MIILDQVKIWFVGQVHFQSTCPGAAELKTKNLALVDPLENNQQSPQLDGFV